MKVLFMQIDHEDLEAATEKGIISHDQATELWRFWQTERIAVPSFRFTHVLYYFGGLIAISSITLFVTQAWDTLRGWTLFVIACLFFFLGIALTQLFLRKRLTIPAGIMATFSLCIVPLAVYNLQVALGYFPNLNYDYTDYHFLVQWYWYPMEIATLIVGLILLYIYRFPFLVFPIAVTLWYMSMDLVPLIFGMTRYTWDDRTVFSMLFGFVFILFAIYVDLHRNSKNKDYAFWLYLFGVMTFWGGLTSHSSTGELGAFVYCMINVVMIFLSVYFNRRVFAVFGAIGVVIYLSHLAYNVFRDSLFFPIILAFIGILIIIAATQWAKVEDEINKKFEPFIPKAFSRRR